MRIARVAGASPKGLNCRQKNINLSSWPAELLPKRWPLSALPQVMLSPAACEILLGFDKTVLRAQVQRPRRIAHQSRRFDLPPPSSLHDHGTSCCCCCCQATAFLWYRTLDVFVFVDDYEKHKRTTITIRLRNITIPLICMSDAAKTKRSHLQVERQTRCSHKFARPPLTSGGLGDRGEHRQENKLTSFSKTIVDFHNSVPNWQVNRSSRPEARSRPPPPKTSAVATDWG